MLKTKNISIGYNKGAEDSVILAKEVNLNLFPGQLTAVIGPNGSGKSTLLNTLSGQLKPLTGSVLIQSQNIEEFSHWERSKYLALVLTKKEFSQHLSVAEFVALGRVPYTNWLGTLSVEDHLSIEQAIEATNLSELLDKKCGTLSDGQMQRVSIARALAQDTPIILLDEPTTHLDLVNKAQTLKLLKTLAQEHKKSVAYATHDIDLALDLADQIISVYGGRINTGSTQEIIDQGIIGEMFQSDLVRFDHKTRRFSISD